MTYKIGDIIYLDENYSNAVNWCDENNATITEIEPIEREVEEKYTETDPETGEEVEKTRKVKKIFRQFRIDEIKPYVPTYEDIRQARIQYRKTHIDDKTLERQRKQANGTWTEEDEQAYLALDAEVTAYIEEHYPYPVE